MAQQIQLRRGTAAEWTSANPILAAGEKGVELDTGLEKTGNGVTPWNSLSYFGGSGGGGGGAVDSVNGLTGVVVINADHISDSGTTKKFATAAEKALIATIEAGADVTDSANVAAAGAAMRSQNLSDLDSATAARSNLGLGGLAVKSGVTVYHDVYLHFAPEAVLDGEGSTIWEAPRIGSLVHYHGQVDESPVGGSLIANLNKDGFSVMDDPDRVTIPVSGFRDTSGLPLDIGFEAGSLFQIVLDQVHATDEGNLGVVVFRITWSEVIS